MKITAILENDVTVGGGFNQALNAILQMKQICSGQFQFEVFTSKHENIHYLKNLGLDAYFFRLTFIDKLLCRFAFARWWQSIQDRIRVVGSFEKALIRHSCDLVYFVTPSGTAAALQRLNYITTVWDLCHRDMCEFPEVRNFNEFKKREHYFQHCLTPAYVVLADSEQLASDIARRYGIDRERLLPMPFAPASFLKSKSALEKAAVLKKYELNEGYYFYPGQFWAHKNHIRILEALIHLRKTGFNFQVVFVGGDQGNQKYIESIVAKENLEGQVRFLGFVPMDDMRGLYEGSVAIVMPTYFGPTNLPPLEAWMVGKPLIYSSHLKDQVGDAAICVNPDDAEELANAMHACTVPETCKELIRSGESKLQEIENVRKNAERELLLRMQKFEIRRRCWL